MLREIDDLVAIFGNELRDNYLEKFNAFAPFCESPIERMFLAAMLYDPEEFGRDWGLRISPMATLPPSLRGSPTLVCDGYLVPQYQIGQYRSDFYIEMNDYEARVNPWLRLIVECDGHAFHERTPTQAAHDKSRDRWFQGEGISVYRFTGSEIYKDSHGCALEILQAIFDARVAYFARGH